MNDDLRKKIEAAYATFPQQVNDGVRLTKKELLNIIEHQEKPNLVRRGDKVFYNGKEWTLCGPDLEPGCEEYVCITRLHENHSAFLDQLTTPDGRQVDGFEETMIELTDERIAKFCKDYGWCNERNGDVGFDLVLFRNKLLKEANER